MRHAIPVSLCTFSTNNPAKRFEGLWSKMDERDGSPEIIEASLKNKLSNPTKLSNTSRDCKKLHGLSDLLFMVQNIKENPQYGKLLSYFDISASVNPVVMKLPCWVQLAEEMAQPSSPV